eukprot:4446110-Heterocapsa_arctica.AAC.1
MKIEGKDRGYMNERGRFSDSRNCLKFTGRSHRTHDTRKRVMGKTTNRETILADCSLTDDTLSEHEETEYIERITNCRHHQNYKDTKQTLMNQDIRDDNRGQNNYHYRHNYRSNKDIYFRYNNRRHFGSSRGQKANRGFPWHSDHGGCILHRECAVHDGPTGKPGPMCGRHEAIQKEADRELQAADDGWRSSFHIQKWA